VALVMALVFLLLLTIIGIGALNTTSLEEKMANNVKDRNLAFQAAESALVLGEYWLNNRLSKPDPMDNSIGLYEPSTGATPVWNSVDWSGTSVVTFPNTPDASGSGTLEKISAQPRYIIERVDEASNLGIGNTGGSVAWKPGGEPMTMYRITARGTGGTNAAIVMVQSTFLRP
jgi:type IV pilus assembly protein PilX